MSARRIELSAPAKLNLGLRITGRRDDGYHLLDSVFVPLDLADSVVVEVDDGAAGATRAAVRLVLGGPAAAGLPADEGNLAVRAARAFGLATGLAPQIRIALDKRVPAGAGLGGGSSDAAAVLRALLQLFPGALSPGVLSEIALELGADVPFFLDPRPARVRGIGEQIEPLAGVPELAVLLANPGISVATAQVYAAWDAHESALTPSGPRPTMPPVFGAGSDAGGPARLAVGALLENDLEAAAVRLCPAIAELRERLEALGARAVGMSGSGATVFGVFSDLAQARAAFETGAFDAPLSATGARGSAASSVSSVIWARVAKTEASPPG